MKPKNKIIFVALLVLSLIFLAGCTSTQSTPHGAPTKKPLYVLQDSSIGPWASTHEHPVLLIFLNGNVLELSKSEYMIRARRVHIEGMDGAILHKHATGITIGHFLETLGMSLDENCFVDDKQNRYCTDEERTLQFYVNGDPNGEFNNYVIRDADRVLVTYGTDDAVSLSGQLDILNSITVST